MKWIFFSLALAVTGVFFGLEKSTAAVLRSEREQYQRDRANVEAARREQTRLLALQPTADKMARLQRASADRAARERAIETAERERREIRSLPVGEWIPQTQWRDRGQTTPTDTLQTLLWASAGGDTGRLAQMLYFDEAAGTKLGKIYEALSPAARALYASPAQLMAAYTAKGIPLGDAQVIWQQESGDDAVVCVWVDDSAAPASDEASKKTDPDQKVPPMLPSNSKRSQALLTLRRFDDGWRVLVPVHAIDKLGRDLGAGK